MARQKELDLGTGMAKLGAFILLMVLLSGGCGLFPDLIWFLVGGAVLISIIAVLIFLIRKTERPPRPLSGSFTFQTVPAQVEIKRALTTDDLIKQLRKMDWFQFEKVVALTYQKMGYTVLRKGGANPDGGIDLVIEKEGVKSAVQCKHWKTWRVGVKDVREFLGAFMDSGIQRGVFITLSGYTDQAKQLAEKHGIEIVNETGLAGMLESVNARFDPDFLRVVEDKRKFCPKCEREMVRRKARQGQYARTEFWGCSAYPRCRFTMQAARRFEGVSV